LRSDSSRAARPSPARAAGAAAPPRRRPGRARLERLQPAVERRLLRLQQRLLLARGVAQAARAVARLRWTCGLRAPSSVGRSSATTNSRSPARTSALADAAVDDRAADGGHDADQPAVGNEDAGDRGLARVLGEREEAQRDGDDDRRRA
jgi:hypothetical protein